MSPRPSPMQSHHFKGGAPIAYFTALFRPDIFTACAILSVPVSCFCELEGTATIIASVLILARAGPVPCPISSFHHRFGSHF